MAGGIPVAANGKFSSLVAAMTTDSGNDFKLPFIGSIDNGTSSTRFMVFDSDGRVVARHALEYPVYYGDQGQLSNEGWVEQEPDEIYDYTRQCMEKVLKLMAEQGFAPSSIKSIGITNQRETTVAWSKSTGKSLGRAIVWMDTRTRDIVKKMIAKCGNDSTYFKKKTGLPFSTYFSALKMKWMLENVPLIAESHSSKDLCLGTVDSWILYKFTGVFKTDVTNASRTMLMSLETLKWDAELLSFFGIDQSSLAEICSSSEVYGLCKSIDGMNDLTGVPFSGILGDQQAALVGQLCLEKGSLKNTYGTGCFLLLNTGNAPVFSNCGMLTTVAFKFGPEGECFYALEGAVANTGNSVKWLRDNMKFFKEAAEIGELADKVPDSGGIYFVPAFSGLFAPHWRDDARGAIVGMSLATKKEHICRATLEAIALQTKDILNAMEKDTGLEINSLRVDGGMSVSNQMMQIQADLGGVTIERVEMAETTAWGAALVAGLSIGVWPSLDHFTIGKSEGRKFEPILRKEEREKVIKGWKKAIEKSFWIEKE